MDIGAGTGILSIFAARAGAKHVYAIEFAEIAIFAKEIIFKYSRGLALYTIFYFISIHLMVCF